MRERDALALDDVPAHRGGVEEHVDDVVVEQVDLVDVEDAAVGVGEEPRLEATLAELDRRLGVDGADDAVLGRVDGQLDDPHPPALDRASDAGRRRGRGSRRTTSPAPPGRSGSGSRR